jgi:tRNA A37 threonylcarbamoyladenosine dehydratase
MAVRLRAAAPGARIDAVALRYSAETAEALVPPGASFVVDAMDTVVAKLHVIRRCLDLGVPIVTSLGAARRLDPTAIQVTDLCETHTDQLAKDVRKYLRRRHGISATGPTGVLAVWSVEEPRRTLVLPGDEAGVPGAARAPAGERRRGPKVFGSAAFVTGAFGLAAAAAVVQRLTGIAPRAHRVLSEREVAQAARPVHISWHDSQSRRTTTTRLGSGDAPSWQDVHATLPFTSGISGGSEAAGR